MGAYVITEPCIDVKDGSCVDVCPVACIHTTSDARQYYIDPDVCIECEQCVVVCPVNAIFVKEEVPEKWAEYIELNAAFIRALKPPAAMLSASQAARMVSAANEFGREISVPFAIVVVDRDGEVLAEVAPNGADAESSALAIARANAAAGADKRAPGACPVHDRLDLIGGVGIAGGNDEQLDLVVRVAIAAFSGSRTVIV